MKKTTKVGLLVLSAMLLASAASALEIVKEVRVDSVNGDPVHEEFTFTGQGYEGFVLKAINGTAEGGNRISSAVIDLNGIKILGPADFNQKVSDVQRTIAPLDNENTLSVSLRSNPGGFIVLQVMGEPTLDLPPDPGPEGDTTIEGIDVNDNGVRDDIERWIGLNANRPEM